MGPARSLRQRLGRRTTAGSLARISPINRQVPTSPSQVNSLKGRASYQQILLYLLEHSDVLTARGLERKPHQCRKVAMETVDAGVKGIEGQDGSKRVVLQQPSATLAAEGALDPGTTHQGISLGEQAIAIGIDKQLETVTLGVTGKARDAVIKLSDVVVLLLSRGARFGSSFLLIALQQPGAQPSVNTRCGVDGNMHNGNVPITRPRASHGAFLCARSGVDACRVVLARSYRDTSSHASVTHHRGKGGKLLAGLETPLQHGGLARHHVGPFPQAHDT